MKSGILWKKEARRGVNKHICSNEKESRQAPGESSRRERRPILEERESARESARKSEKVRAFKMRRLE